MKKLFAVLIALQLIILPMPTARANIVSGMANQLRGIAIASVGSTVISSCKLGAMSPSLKVFMGAALIYLAGELAAGKGQKGELESTSAEVDSSLGGRGGDTQLKVLEAQLKDKEEKKKVADKRAAFTAAAMAAMTAAAVVAVTEIPRQYTLPPTMLPLGCIPAEATAKGKMVAAGVTAGFSFLTGGGLMGALTSAVGSYLLGMTGMVAAMNKAEGRAAVFGALAGFTGLAMMDAQKDSSKLAGEIKQLKLLIAQFKKETYGEGNQTEDTTAGANGGATGAEAGLLAGVTSGAASGAGPGAAMTMLPDAQLSSNNKVCITANGASTDCSTPLRVPSVNFSGLGLGPEVQQVASQGIELGNDIASGSTGAKADIAAASLASSAAKVNEELKKQLAKANANLRAQGKKQVDFDKEVADTIKSYNDAVQQEALKNGTSLASLGLGDATLDPNAAAAAAQEINSASTDEAAAVPTSNGDMAAAVADPTSLDAFANSVTPKAEENVAEALGKELYDYESNENDISKNSGESLWRQVSNRYLLNYNRFFERKKEAPAGSPAQ